MIISQSDIDKLKSQKKYYVVYIQSRNAADFDSYKAFKNPFQVKLFLDKINPLKIQIIKIEHIQKRLVIKIVNFEQPNTNGV